MTAEFQLYKLFGQYCWRLQAGDSEIVASGEVYPSRDAAERGIAAVRTAAPNAPITDKTGDVEQTAQTSTASPRPDAD